MPLSRFTVIPVSSADWERMGRDVIVTPNNNSVTAQTIAADAVIETKIAPSAVTGTKIATDAVTDTKIAASAVTDSKLAINSVTTTKILDANVTLAKLADMTAGVIGRTTGTGVPGVVSFASLLSALSIVPGTWTPTLTNVTNLAASTAYLCQYVQVGSIVLVAGKVSVDPTAAGAVELGLSLPVASDFGAEENCGGVAFASAIAGMGAAILADSVNNRMALKYVAVDTTNQPMFFVALYRVI